MNRRIMKQIEKYDIISFDIFDTLLNRNVNNCNEVFKYMEICYKLDNFKNKRIEAEKIAKEKLNKESVTLDEIYDYLDYSSKNQIKELEINCEKQILALNNYMKPIYDYCKKCNKKIIAISDMYLNSKNLKEILETKGIFVDDVFSSCDFNKTKNNGKLFKQVLKILNIDKKKILHIGNSFKSDYIMPKSIGINALYIKNRPLKEKDKKRNYNLEKFLSNNFKNNENYYYNFGYNSFGPLLLGFSEWLKNELRKNNIKKVFFLARDGYFINQVFDLKYKKEFITSYLYVSRKSVRVPLLFKYSKFESLENHINTSSYFSINTFIKRIGLNPQNYYNFTLLNFEKEYRKKDFFNDEQIKKFYNKYLKNDMILNSKKQFDLLKKYLSQENFEDNIGIVDIGWEGTIQDCLQELCGDSVNIYGYYFGVNKCEKNKKGFLYDTKNISEKETILASYGLFETLFLAEHGSTDKYNIIDNEVVPYLSDYEFASDNNINLELNYVRDIHRGAIDFCKDIGDLNCIYKIDEDRSCFRNLKKILVYPSHNDIKKLGVLQFYDSEVVNLIDKNVKPTNFFKAVKKSVWKIGFLKYILKLNLPYYKIYCFLKRGRNHGKN